MKEVRIKFDKPFEKGFKLRKLQVEGYNSTIITTERNVGKTTDLGKVCIAKTRQNFTAYDPIANKMLTKNKNFLGVRRTKDEIDELLRTIKFSIKDIGGYNISYNFYDKNHHFMGRLAYLSGMTRYKSQDFSHTCFVVYDEFISETGRGLTNEFSKWIQFLISIERFKTDHKMASDGKPFELVMISNLNSVNNPYFVALDLGFDKDCNCIMRPDDGIIAYKLTGNHFPNLDSDKTTAKKWAKYDDEVYKVAYQGENGYDKYAHLLKNPRTIEDIVPVERFMLNDQSCVLGKYDGENYILTTKGKEPQEIPMRYILRKDGMYYGISQSEVMVRSFARKYKSLLELKMIKFNNYDLITYLIEFIITIEGKTNNGEAKRK